MSLIKLIKWSGNLKLVRGRNKMETVYYVQDAVLPELTVTLYDEDGNAADLTGYTFTFSMLNVVDGTVKVDAASMTAVDLSNGKIKYVWADGDLDTPGEYYAEIVGTVNSKKEPIEELFRIVVRKKLN